MNRVALLLFFLLSCWLAAPAAADDRVQFLQLVLAYRQGVHPPMLLGSRPKSVACPNHFLLDGTRGPRLQPPKASSACARVQRNNRATSRGSARG